MHFQAFWLYPPHSPSRYQFCPAMLTTDGTLLGTVCCHAVDRLCTWVRASVGLADVRVSEFGEHVDGWVRKRMSG